MLDGLGVYVDSDTETTVNTTEDAYPDVPTQMATLVAHDKFQYVLHRTSGHAALVVNDSGATPLDELCAMLEADFGPEWLEELNMALPGLADGGEMGGAPGCWLLRKRLWSVL